MLKLSSCLSRKRRKIPRVDTAKLISISPGGGGPRGGGAGGCLELLRTAPPRPPAVLPAAAGVLGEIGELYSPETIILFPEIIWIRTIRSEQGRMTRKHRLGQHYSFCAARSLGWAARAPPAKWEGLSFGTVLQSRAYPQVYCKWRSNLSG